MENSGAWSACQPPYGEDYARVYDLLVHGEEQAAEEADTAAFLEWSFRSFARRPVADVLDAGCGTGRVLASLAGLGYSCTGLDNSEGMLDACRRRLEREGRTAVLANMGMERLNAEEAFDAVLCMDSALAYLAAPDLLDRQLGLFRNALRPGGVLIVDNWNFLAQWPSWGRLLGGCIESEGVMIETTHTQWYDTWTSQYHIDETAVVIQGEETREASYHHVLYVSTPAEMLMRMERAGFEGCKVFPDFTIPIGPGELLQNSRRLIYRGRVSL